jgi:hypothetical protein
MRFPSPRPGIRVYHPTDETITGIMTNVNIVNGTFTFRSGEILVHGLSLDNDYKPENSRENFERGLEEWDYFYGMSDDPRIFEEGSEQEEELGRMFKVLSTKDQHHYRKVMGIIAHISFKFS